MKKKCYNKRIWVYITSKKSTTENITYSNGKTIHPNLTLIKLKNIELITTKGLRSNLGIKNFIRIQLLDGNNYYLYSSIRMFVNDYSHLFVRINKSEAINYTLVTSRLNNQYLFIGHNYYKVTMKNSVEKIFR